MLTIRNLCAQENPTTSQPDPAPQKAAPWLEGIHNTVSGTVYHSARWFDNFFTDDDSEQLNPKTNLRVRLGWAPDKYDTSTTEKKFKLRVKLPHLKNKVDLIFSDDDLHDDSNSELENVANSSGNDFESFTAAIRYVHSQTLGSLLDSRLGITAGDIFYRTRYKKRLNWYQNHSIKFEPSVTYYLADGWASKTIFEYNYNLSNIKQFRVSNLINSAETFKGIKWTQGAHMLHQLSDSSASAYGASIDGIHKGESGSMVHTYKLSYKYRFNALRERLFFEVEPFYQWQEQHNYHGSPGIALRVEGHFVRE